jgi:hypothetical protein
VKGTKILTDMLCNDTAAFFGPEFSCAVEATVAAAWNRTMISYVRMTTAGLSLKIQAWTGCRKLVLDFGFVVNSGVRTGLCPTRSGSRPSPGPRPLTRRSSSPSSRSWPTSAGASSSPSSRPLPADPKKHPRVQKQSERTQLVRTHPEHEERDAE